MWKVRPLDVKWYYFVGRLSFSRCGVPAYRTHPRVLDARECTKSGYICQFNLLFNDPFFQWAIIGGFVTVRVGNLRHEIVEALAN